MYCSFFKDGRKIAASRLLEDGCFINVVPVIKLIVECYSELVYKDFSFFLSLNWRRLIDSKYLRIKYYAIIIGL